jgi:PAT family beta-lactamase induction signal transducer AmpG
MDKQGAMAAAYQVGYRTALMVASAGALIIADESGFRTAYLTMAGLVSVGILTTLLVHEPQRKVADNSDLREQRVVDWLAARAHWPAWMQRAGAWFVVDLLSPSLSR